jgi:uncharacterized protein YegL
MSGTIGLVKECLKFVAKELEEKDRLSVVTFDSHGRTEFGLTVMDTAGKAKAMECVSKISARGMTHLSGGLNHALLQVQESKAYRAAVAVVILFTDGMPTAGLRKNSQIEEAVKNQLLEIPDHYKSVSLFSFGFGNSHDSQLLYNLANSAKGCYGFIEEKAGIADHLGACFGFANNIAVCDVTLKIESAGKNVLRKAHTRYDVDENGAIKLGEINCEGERHVLLDLSIDAEEESHAATATVRYYDIETKSYQETTCTVPVVRGEDTQTINEDVELHRMRLLTAKTLEEVAELGNQNKFEAAIMLMKEAIQTIEGSIVAEDELCMVLASDLRMCSEGLQHQKAFLAGGKHILTSKAMGHHKQTGRGHTTRYQEEMIQGMAKLNTGNTNTERPVLRGTYPSDSAAGTRSPAGGHTVSAGYVMINQVIMHHDKPHRIVNKTTSKSGKHGHAKVFLQLEALQGGKKAETIIPVNQSVPLYVPAPSAATSSPAPVVTAAGSRKNCPACDELDLKVPEVTLPSCGHKMCMTCYGDLSGQCILCM